MLQKPNVKFTSPVYAVIQRHLRIWMTAFIVFIFSPVFYGCKTTDDTSAISLKNISNDELIKDDRYLGLLLMAMSKAPPNFKPSLLKADEKELTRAELKQHARDATRRLTLILGPDLTEGDQNILFSYGLVVYAHGLLKLGKYDDAQAVVAYIFSSPQQSLSTYTIALGIDSVAVILKIEESDDEKKQALLEQLDFNFLQSDQCQRLCDSHGWQTLALDSSENLTERWYLNQLLNNERFNSANKKRPEWYNDLFLASTKKLEKEADLEKLPDVLNMQTLMKENQIARAAKIAREVLHQGSSTEPCEATKIYAHHVFAIQKRRGQDRTGFLKNQEQLVGMLDKQKCAASHFLMSDDEFNEFVVNARLWLARLYWEVEKNLEAEKLTRQALNFAEEKQLWEYYFEAVQVLIGRVGFEIYKPDDNVRFLTQIEPLLAKNELHEFAVWTQYRKGLFQYLGGRFSESIDTFKKIEKASTEAGVNAASYYWLGRAYQALRRSTEAQNAMMQTGAIDPLGFYDLLSGQFLKLPSGRTSTAELSPFAANWKVELDKWISLSSSKPFALFEPIKWIGRKLGISSHSAQILSEQAKNFSVALHGDILLVSALRAVFFKPTFDEFSRLLRDTDSMATRLIKSEANWLKTTYQQKFSKGDLFVQNRDQIAWLLYVTGDYVNSITFVGSIRGKLDFNFTPSSFLYFIFYPRPYQNAYVKAANICKIDVDLLYAVSRQESLFQKDVVSGAGAIGLMQLLPPTAKRTLNKLPEYKGSAIDLKNPQTNITAGACYLKELIERYQGNLTFAIAAYNAGEKIVDKWVKNRLWFKDMPFFTEFIPYAETQKYVQRVLRNYYNIKWIYSR